LFWLVVVVIFSLVLRISINGTGCGLPQSSELCWPTQAEREIRSSVIDVANFWDEASGGVMKISYVHSDVVLPADTSGQATFLSKFAEDTRQLLSGRFKFDDFYSVLFILPPNWRKYPGFRKIRSGKEKDYPVGAESAGKYMWTLSLNSAGMIHELGKEEWFWYAWDVLIHAGKDTCLD
jgi:hypothetical protein